MVREGVLDPAKSGEFIAARAKFVEIHAQRVERLAQEVVSSFRAGKISIPETNSPKIPIKEHPRGVDWIFVTDALNFCFWTNPGTNKWSVNKFTGYYALEAALKRAMDEGYDIVSPNYYSQMTKQAFEYIMRGDNGNIIPLAEERLKILHEVGKVLIEKFSGTFQNCIIKANKCATSLLKLVVEEFHCFRDEAVFDDHHVSFYKRAQVLVSHLWNVYKGKSWGELKGLERLTMFADYRVPQVLLYFGAISYSEDLLRLLKKKTLINNGSREEVEIRGCSIQAVELVKSRMKQILQEAQNVDEAPNSADIDYFLWTYRRQHAAALKHIPFHRTLCIYY